MEISSIFKRVKSRFCKDKKVLPTINHVRRNTIGERQLIYTPFGQVPLVYTDYTASGRSLKFVEDFIRDRVLPYYASTHTKTSFTGT